METAPYSFVIDWEPDGSYRLWSFDPQRSDPLPGAPVQRGKWSSIQAGHHLAPIGSYVFDWDPGLLSSPYRLWNLEPTASDPLPGHPVKEGTWYDFTEGHQLVTLANYLLDWVPHSGSYGLWNFDPQSSEFVSSPPLQSGTWSTVREGQQLIPIGGYVLDWEPENGNYHLWSFDPQSPDPLPGPAVQKGNWGSIRAGHQLVPIGDYVIDWVASDGSYRLWRFDPGSSDPLGRDTVQEGKWDTIGDQHTLVGVQPTIPLGAASSTPATLDYMRSKIKKIVFYMLENRSFDHVCGWLYEHDVPSHLIGSTEQYDGANSKYFNVDAGGKKIYVSKYEGENLDCPTEGAKHDHGDVMNQLFEPFDKTYAKKNSPPMTGFVLDNATGQTMETYTPERLSVLNGLAKAYAISDAWFCSLPGPTDLNRAFSLTGSSFGFTTSFESGRSYQYWPNTPHRPSIWKVLWDNGFDDWTIYYPDDWEGFCYTYHLFLKGQIPTVDANRSPHLKTMEDHFYQEASNGSLPRFSFIEPAWIGGDPKGGDRPPNSYHPPMDLVPGEITLNNVYNALFGEGTTLQQREETLLVITFDEHGGQYDHVSPPYGARPYANDKDSKSGFEFDLFGVRVPTILVSPWIEEKTVFRSQTPVQYDSTSILATVLSWYGVPKERWGLGERTAHAPTFESVFTRETARTDQPAFTPPLAEKTLGASDIPLNDLHRLFVPRILWHLAGGKIDDDQLDEAAQDIQNRANNVEELHNLLAAFQESIAQMN